MKPGTWLASTELTVLAFKVSPRCLLTVNVQDKTVGCNFHTDISPSSDDKAKDARSALARFEDNQDELKVVLDKYFKEDLS